MATFLLASAGASAAYLTSSEIFPMETRALSIAFFYAIGTAVGGVAGPLLFGPLISTGSKRLVGLAFVIGAVLMAGGGVTELVFGVRAEQAQLEDIAKPLTAEEAETPRPAGPGGPTGDAPTGDSGEEVGLLAAAPAHRARAAAQRAAAAEARADLRRETRSAAPGNGAHTGTGTEGTGGAAVGAEGATSGMGGTDGAFHPVRAAELRARSHNEEAQALLSADDTEADRHRRLAAAALERARSAEQLALAAEARRGRRGGEEAGGGEAGEERTRREIDAAAHDAWAEMHAHRAEAIEHEVSGHVHLAAALGRRADQAEERARALTFQQEAAEHRSRAVAEQEEHDARLAASAGGAAQDGELARARLATQAWAEASADDDRIRERMTRRGRRELSGIRRYRPGLGRLGRAFATTVTPPLAEEALDHEIVAIERALQDHGATDRRKLARMVGARYWGPGVFTEVLRQAVADGAVRRLSRRVYAPAGEVARAGAEPARAARTPRAPPCTRSAPRRVADRRLRQPPIVTTCTRRGRMRATTRRSPGRSCWRRSLSYFAPSRSAMA